MAPCPNIQGWFGCKHECLNVPFTSGQSGVCFENTFFAGPSTLVFTSGAFLGALQWGLPVRVLTTLYDVWSDSNPVVVF